MPDTPPTPSFRSFHLFALGFVTLFLELALIRYLSGNIWNLGYFPNLVLVAVFIGMGLGFVGHDRFDELRSRAVYVAAAAALFVLIVFVSLLHPSLPGFGPWQGIIGGELYFSSTPENSSSAAMFVVWAVLVVVVFAGIAQRTAKAFRAFAPLQAYTIDIAGALCGIIAFALCSGVGAPPSVWFAVTAAVAAVGAGPATWTTRVAAAALVLACGGIAHWQDTRLLASPEYPGELVVRWSPYQKLELAQSQGHPFIFANGLGHQVMFEEETLRKQLYFTPHDARAVDRPGKPYRHVLIIGAGSGNDVAAALRSGAERVDAVDIDPRIPALGREHHPLKPYDDPRVTLHVDDGRAFMNTTQTKYDLIIFALTDSVVKVSAMSQLRLENYLFTQESVARARALLEPGGSLVLYNFYRTPWLMDKLEWMLRDGTGKEPDILQRTEDFVVFRIDEDGQAATAGPHIDVATDDWPFPYLEQRGIPPLYAWMLLGMALVVFALLAVVHLAGRREAVAGEGSTLAAKLAFLAMGVAFLLLETKSVVQFSLLFGTTWKNAAIVFAGVLALVLAANRTVPPLSARFGGRNLLWPVYLALLASCVVGYVVPLASLASIEATSVRVVAAVLLTFAPLYFANLLFGVAFNDTKAPEHLFGWNLIGATLGGALEYTCMATGYRALGVLVALLYSAAFLLLVRSTRAS